jgi:hypothetical protein
MIPLVTWLSIIVLGPGAVAVFVWFLVDLRRVPRGDKFRSQ